MSLHSFTPSRHFLFVTMLRSGFLHLGFATVYNLVSVRGYSFIYIWFLEFQFIVSPLCSLCLTVSVSVLHVLLFWVSCFIFVVILSLMFRVHLYFLPCLITWTMFTCVTNMFPSVPDCPLCLSVVKAIVCLCSLFQYLLSFSTVFLVMCWRLLCILF